MKMEFISENQIVVYSATGDGGDLRKHFPNKMVHMKDARYYVNLTLDECNQYGLHVYLLNG